MDEQTTLHPPTEDEIRAKAHWFWEQAGKPEPSTPENELADWLTAEHSLWEEYHKAKSEHSV